jgi:transposase
VETTSLPDLLGKNIESFNKDRYYRVSDRLLKYRKEIEQHLNKQLQSLFNLNRTIILYDLTNTHFEGVCKRNRKAKRGHNKQKRNECAQIVVGMIFDEHGFPVLDLLGVGLSCFMVSEGNFRVKNALMS